MRALCILFVSFALATPALAQSDGASPHDPARLFPHEAPITAEGEVDALHRLPLPGEVLERARPDLSDVRIHDASGQEVPFLVDSGVRTWPRDASSPSFVGVPIAVDRRIEDGESLAPTWREILRVATPGSAPAGARWTLRLESSAYRFVRQVVVRRVDAGDAVEVARGSIYRFDEPLRERLTIALPPLPDAAVLEVELVGEGGYIEPELRFRASREPVDAPTLTLPLAELARERRDGSTWIELSRPVGVAPDRIRVRTSTAHFHREVRVFDVIQGEAPRELGRGQLFRVRELQGAEVVELDVSAARGESLRLEVVDGDSPALAELTVEALVRQPVLLFARPHSTATLRFGGGRAHAPRYDIGFFRGTLLGEEMTSAPLARLGAVRPNPRYDSAPALGFAMRPGRPGELARFTHVAPVEVRDAPEGLSALRLPPAVLSLARFDLADLRIVDGDGKQWPFLMADNEERELAAAEVGAPKLEERRSEYVITPPVDRARLDRAVLHTDEPFLARAFVLRGIDDDGRRAELTRGVLRRAPDETGALEVAFPTTRASRLELEVEDGSDAPIAFTKIELGIASPTLYLAAPVGEYHLLVGDPEASAPEYEIARARSLVLAVRATPGTVGDPQRNAAHVKPPWYEAAERTTWLVWALLLLSVIVLGVLTLRLARSAEAEVPSSESPPPGPGPGSGSAPVSGPAPESEPASTSGPASESEPTPESGPTSESGPASEPSEPASSSENEEPPTGKGGTEKED